MASSSMWQNQQGGAASNKRGHSKDELIRSYETSQFLGFNGGTVQLAGCSLSVPRKALDEIQRLTMKMNIVRRAQYGQDEMILFGPELNLGPDGTRFSQPVTVSVPTCYAGIKGQKALVEIQTKESSSDPWEKCQEVLLTEKGNVEFNVLHFSPYRFLMRMLGIEKSIAHMSFTRQNNDENEYEMIWCFCDNIRETRLEVQKEMSLQDFNLTKTTETFTMSLNDNIQASLIIPECNIEDSIQTISPQEIWFSDSIVKMEFIISNLQGGMKINYKLEKIRNADEEPYLTKENAFVFQPNTSRMDQGSSNTVIVNPNIDHMTVG